MQLLDRPGLEPCGAGWGGIGRDGAGTGYRNASYSRGKLILKVRTNPRQVRHCLGGVPDRCWTLHVALPLGSPNPQPTLG